MSTSALLLGLWSMTMVESSSSSSSSSFLRKSVRDYRVHGLEDIEPAFAQFDGHMYAGLMSTIDVTSKHHSAEDEEGALMFWLFVPSEPVYDDTLVIWLNGGPGCSSMSGCLFENCPATIPRKPAGYFPIDAQAPLEPNPYAWTHATPIMYVEQPHGTGFSQGPYPNNETDVGRDFYNFLQNLFDLFDNDPEAETQLRNKRLHFFGESYAGTYHLPHDFFKGFFTNGNSFCSHCHFFWISTTWIMRPFRHVCSQVRRNNTYNLFKFHLSSYSLQNRIISLLLALHITFTNRINKICVLAFIYRVSHWAMVGSMRAFKVRP
jgi:hypothetical protein